MDLESHGSSTDDGGQYDDADDDMYEAVNGNGEQFRGLNLQFPMGNGKDKVPSSSSAANTKSGNDLSSLDKTPKLSNSDETVDDEKFLELPKSPGPRPPPLPVPNVPNSSISQQSDVPTSATRSGSPRLGEEIKGLNIGGLKLDGSSFSSQNYNAKLSYSTNENVSNSSTSDQSDTDDVKRSQQFKFGGASHSSNTDSQKQQSSRNPKSPTFQNSSSSLNPNLQINNNAPNSSLTNNQFSPLLSEQGQEKFDSISNTANGNNNNNNSGGVSRSFSISKRLFTRHKKSSSSQDKISVGNNHANNDSDIFNDKRKSTENKRKNFENSIASSILPSKSKSPTPKFSHNRSVSETETINEYPRIGEISKMFKI
ncbi:unnamed protein product [[Candida] boidinii]|uniref:Unnamed protein product n=1 Tax=Candida boidinii TaxID=5477 RepID=A0A9W6T7P4_CANBO|nr:unnamed protein product [[Candida] boidinii]